MSPADKEALIEAVAGSHRRVDPDGRIRSAPAFHDLDARGREAAFERALESRMMEAALDPEGLSSTAKRVLAMIRRS
jgi:hypothetical protein